MSVSSVTWKLEDLPRAWGFQLAQRQKLQPLLSREHSALPSEGLSPAVAVMRSLYLKGWFSDFCFYNDRHRSSDKILGLPPAESTRAEPCLAPSSEDPEGSWRHAGASTGPASTFPQQQRRDCSRRATEGHIPSTSWAISNSDTLHQ